MVFMMSRFVSIDDEYEICLSMTWYPGGSHLISGHVYEIVDYYVILSKCYNVCILFGDTFTDWKSFRKVIVSKYSLPAKTLKSIELNTLYAPYPKYIKGRNILFVDGGLCRLQKQGTALIFDNILTFKCAYTETISDLSYNVTILQDNRVYKDLNPDDTKISHNYIKKINFDIIKEHAYVKNRTGLLYLTKNCRSVSNKQIDDVISQTDLDHYIIVTDDPAKYKLKDCITIIRPPVNNLFDIFSEYIYMPLKQQFDGSPRLPAECKYYGKSVTYHDDIDELYLQKDTGLRWRKHDIEHNFDSLRLTESDDIFNILSTTINE